jgi:hypothetical protein
VNGFIDYLYTPPGITSNYSSVANLRTLQITTAPAKPFPASCIFNDRSLATASNSEDFSASRCQVLYIFTASRAELNSRVTTQLTGLELLYDWRFTANQFVLAASPLGLTTRIFFFH